MATVTAAVSSILPSLHLDVIAGGVVGAVALLAFISGVTVCFARRARAHRAVVISADEHMPVNAHPSDTTPSPTIYSSVRDLDDTGQNAYAEVVGATELDAMNREITATVVSRPP
jgi:hypothetical protein